MRIREGKSLENLKDVKLSDDSLALEHRLDISASIYKRMKELGLTQKDLAVKLGMDTAQISRIIRAKQNLTIATLAKIENALDFSLADGFHYAGKTTSTVKVVCTMPDTTCRRAKTSSWSKPITYSENAHPHLKEVA